MKQKGKLGRFKQPIVTGSDLYEKMKRNICRGKDLPVPDRKEMRTSVLQPLGIEFNPHLVSLKANSPPDHLEGNRALQTH